VSVALIADAHLGGPGGSPDLLVRQLEELAGQGCRKLVLLGDLFHVWVGQRRFETPEVAAVVPVLRGLRRQGVSVEYVEGNRDFFLRGGSYEDAFDRIGSEVDFEVGGRQFLAVHGDGLNDRDWLYRFWRRLSKSELIRFLSLRLPAGMARRLVHSTEQRLAEANFKHKIQIPEEVIRAYAERRMAEGYDVLLLGHFHQADRWPVAGGEVRLVEAWFLGRRVEWFRS
jgi:UDP-2,3-diacylglucosamine pyrophosphatase LpxH